MTAWGKKARSIQADWVKRTARTRPSTAETRKAAAVMASVTRREGNSVPQSVTTVRAMRRGPGRIYGGIPCQRTTPSQVPRASTPISAGARTRLLDACANRRALGGRGEERRDVAACFEVGG